MKKYLALWLLVLVSIDVDATPLGPKEAYVLLNGATLWKDSAGALTVVENLTLGSKVTLLGMASRFKEGGEEHDFVRVRVFDGKEGWVRGQFLAARSRLAVVKADRAVVFSEPREVKITGRFVTPMTVVAVLQDGGRDGFVRIQGYDRTQKLLLPDPAYLDGDDLTAAEADVKAAILVAAADDNPKVGPTTAPARPARETVPASGTYVVNDNNVNVRVAPDEKTGEVIGKVNRGRKVEVTEMTAQAYKVAGIEAAWFHLKDPDGWVFGAFLDKTE